MTETVHITVSDYINLGGELKPGRKIFTGKDLEGFYHKYTFVELTHKGMQVVGTDTLIGTGWTYVEATVGLVEDDDQQEDLLETLNQNVIKNYARWTLDMIPEDEAMTEDDCDCHDWHIDDFDNDEILEHLEKEGYSVGSLIHLQNDIVTDSFMKDFFNNFHKLPRHKLEKLIEKHR